GRAKGRGGGRLGGVRAGGAGLIAARRIFGEIVAVRRVGAATTATADLREFARAAAATQLRLAQVVEDGRLPPQLGERRLPEIARGNRHVGTRRDVALRGDPAVVLAGRTGAVGVGLEERGRRIELIAGAA